MIKATIEIDNGTHVVLLQDEEGNKMVTSVLPLLDMIKSGKEIEVEGDNVVSKEVRHYQLNLKENEDIVKGIKGMVGEIRREIESYNNSKVFPVNELFDDVEMIHTKEIVDKYLKSNELQLGTIQPYCPPIHMKEEKFPTCTTRGEGEDFIGVHTGYQIKPASKEQDYTGMKVEIDGITGTVEYTDVYDGLALRFRGKEAGFLELTPDGIKMPRFELDDMRMWIHARELQEGAWDVFDSKIGIGAQASTPGEAIKLYLEKLKDNDFAGRGYLRQVGITEDTRMIGEFNKCKNIINIEVILKYNELLKKDEREDMAMKGGEQEPTLDVLFVFFNIKDINGEPVPHFMVPSLTVDNAYIMEEGCDDPASLVKKALGDYKLSAGDMEYLGWEGDTPPRITKEDVKDMVHVDDCVLVTRKVPKKLIARD